MMSWPLECWTGNINLLLVIVRRFARIEAYIGPGNYNLLPVDARRIACNWNVYSEFKTVAGWKRGHYPFEYDSTNPEHGVTILGYDGLVFDLALRGHFKRPYRHTQGSHSGAQGSYSRALRVNGVVMTRRAWRGCVLEDFIGS